MVHIRQLDPTASPLDYFGYELRRKREEAGLTLKQLGSVLFCSGSLIGQIETTLKVPTRDFAERLDAALVTDGMFSRMVGLVLRSQLPTWFQPYAELEAKATYISTYQCQLVYGLLQTKAYAAALLCVDHPDRVEEMVAARKDRQRILEREQLAHLLSFRNNQSVHIQVLPYSVGAHTGMMGTFTLLRVDEHPNLFYSESYDQGHMTPNPQAIRERSVGYARL